MVPSYALESGKERFLIYRDSFAGRDRLRRWWADWPAGLRTLPVQPTTWVAAGGQTKPLSRERERSFPEKEEWRRRSVTVRNGKVGIRNSLLSRPWLWALVLSFCASGCIYQQFDISHQTVRHNCNVLRLEEGHGHMGMGVQECVSSPIVNV